MAWDRHRVCRTGYRSAVLRGAPALSLVFGEVMRVRVPRDHSSLADALASGADRIVLSGVVALPEGSVGAILSRPVHITGGRLRGAGGWALVVGEGVRLTGVKIENPSGHGVRIVAGAPVLEDVEIRVQGVAGVCEGHSRPVLRRVVVDGAENGWLLREDTAPDGDELAVNASGSALVTSDRAGGHLARLAVMSGAQFACVEAHGDSHTTLSGLTVLSAGCGALHIYGRSRLVVQGGHVRQSGTADARFPAIEIRETATPEITALRVDQSGGRAMFLHGEARPVFRSVTIDQTGSNAVEGQGQVVLDAKDLTIQQATGAGVVFRGEVTGRIETLTVDQTSNVGVGLTAKVKLDLSDVTIRGAEGAALRIAGEARGVVRKARLELLGCPAVWVQEQGALTLLDASIGQNRTHGIQVEDEARLLMRGGTVRENQGRGIAASGRARARFDGVVVQENGGWNVELSDQAEARWAGGPAPERCMVHPEASWSEASARDSETTEPTSA
ncbi:MAG TPA: hypothetical protein DFR83_28015 [Deltaproteobacteria bacterium]|nr:hypothetical protein [Deltaproteobacteria bacterium]